MDNFMDKLAQRFNAQEIIKANSQAEAQELDRLREQMDAYDACLQEMRKLNLKNIEGLEEMHALAGQIGELADKAAAGMEKEEGGNEALEKLSAGFEEIKEFLAEKTAYSQEETNAVGEEVKAVQTEVKAIQEEIKEALEEERALLGEIKETAAANQSRLDTIFSDVEDFMHKESVKVYRNVQAVVIDELKNQTVELDYKLSQKGKGNSLLLLFVVLTMLSSLGILGIEIVRIFGLI